MEKIKSDEQRPDIVPVAPDEATKWRDPSLVGKYMVDPKTGLAGLWRSPDNGKTWVLTDTVFGHVFNQDEAENIWNNGTGHKVKDEIDKQLEGMDDAKSAADSAVQAAESAVAASKVNSDAIVAQSEAISEAKAAADSAAAEIQQTRANAASDVAAIEKNVANVQADIQQAQASNASVAAQLNDVVDQAKSQDKTIKSIQDTVDGYATMIADASGNATMAKQTADSATVVARDAQHDINVLKVDAKGLHDTLTGQGNQLASLNVTLNSLDSKYSGITGDLQSKQTALSTEQQQTKDMLLNKADKSEVDSVKGTVNQVSAEQKLMADQISSKVSAAEYQKDKTDTITAIQKNSTAIDETNKLVSIKADKTEINSLNNTAQQLSARLNVIAGQVQSKVDETRVNNLIDGRGFATQSTVQSLIDQRAGTLSESITNLTTELANSGGGVNLISGTTEDIVVDDTGNTGNQGWCFKTIPINADLKVGDKITVSAESVTLTGRGDLSKWGATLYSKDISEMRANNYEVNAGNNTKVTITVTSMNDASKQTALLIYSGRVSDTEGKKAVFHHLKVERGEIATPYSQAPSDNATVTQLQSVTASIDGLQSNVTNFQNNTKSQFTQLSNVMQSKISSADFNALKQRVDMQTLDSADINNMKTNGHYFVHNLANNPIGGWVYVDVTGNGNDRIRQDVYQDSGLKHKYRRWFGTYWTGWEEGATYTEITQLQDAVNLRVQKGELLSQINLTAGNTLIQSNKLYLDASSVVFSGRAFIPSAAIASLSADKINTGTLNTDKISLSNGHVRLSSDDDHFYVQTEENAVNNPTTRFNFDGIDFMDSSYGKEVPQYSIGYDTSSADRHLYINAFDHFNSGGTTASQLWYSMVPAISLNNQEINFAAKGNMHMQVVDGGVNIKPTLFFQNNTNNGTYTGFTRLDNSNTVEFNTGDNNGENFHVNSGARFMKYVYFNDYCRAQGWLTYSTLSKKTNIKKLDTSLALDKIRQDDQYLYEYKRNVAKGVYDPQASFIIDDVNDVSHYSVPREFIDQTGKYREPSVELSYLIAAFQEIDKQVQTQKEEIKELKEKLQHE